MLQDVNIFSTKDQYCKPAHNNTRTTEIFVSRSNYGDHAVFPSREAGDGYEEVIDRGTHGLMFLVG